MKLAEAQPEAIQGGERISAQESALRYVIVLVVGALHVYLEALVEEWGDKLGRDWADLSTLQMRYVTIQARRAIDRLLVDTSEGELWEE